MKEPIRSDSQDEGALPADFGCAQPVGLTHNPITKQHPWLPCSLTWMLSLFALPKGHFGDGTWERVLFIYLFIYLFLCLYLNIIIIIFSFGFPKVSPCSSPARGLWALGGSSAQAVSASPSFPFSLCF